MRTEPSSNEVHCNTSSYCTLCKGQVLMAEKTNSEHACLDELAAFKLRELPFGL